MKRWIVLLLLFNCVELYAARLTNGDLVVPGDSIQSVYQQWGAPTIRATTERTCGKVIAHKKTYCSTRRLIWQQGDTYWMFQVHGNMVIKLRWTRNKRVLKKKF